MEGEPRKTRVLRLRPAPAIAAPIGAADALQDDPLEAQLAAVGEHDRALVSDRCAKLDVVDSCDQPCKRRSPLFERAFAEILALEAEKVEGDE